MGRRSGVVQAAIYLLAYLIVVCGDQCINPTEDALASHMSARTSPRGGVDAGVYSKITSVDNFGDCVKACCKDKQCNAVFHTKEYCLTIQCKSDELCAPGNKSDSLAGAILINLRTVDETGKYKTVSDSSGETSPRANTVCEFGLLDCHVNEECRTSTKDVSRAKNGLCQCKDGFMRDVNGGCVVAAHELVNRTISNITAPIASTFAPEPTLLVTSATATSAATSTATSTIVTTASSTVAVTTVQKVVKLVVSAGDNRELEYPQDSVTLTAYAVPEAKPGEVYAYHWSLLQQPAGDGVGETKGIDEPALQLSKLVVGFYSAKVEVSGPNKYGVATVNITVKPAAKVNTPPVAVIKPTVLKMKQDTVGILDGADSRDDEEVKKYLWEIVSGPMSGQLENKEGSMLRLNGLSPGNYSVRLTVSDEHNLTNSTLATVVVEEAVDYPPKANAGDDQIVTLPQNSVSLYGNASSDDKGIVRYEWKAKAKDAPADIDGVDKPVLHLSHLREGVYTFELTVTDTKGQTATDEVYVYVKSSQNKPPVAAVDTNVTTVTPGTVVVLDGSASTDDQTITKYQWTQFSGPKPATMDNTDRAKANVEGLVLGDYVFRLTVFDEEDLHSSVDVTVQVKDEDSKKPVAHAGEDIRVMMPVYMIKLDGSKSTKVGGKLTYHWTRSDESPGAGDVVNGTDRQPVLLVTGVVPGTYIFTLTVKDTDGVESSDTVTVNVEEDPDEMNMVELAFDTSIEVFTQKHKNNLAVQLGLMLTSEGSLGDPIVDIVGIHPDYLSGKLAVIFLVKDKDGQGVSTRNGTLVKSQLQQKLKKNSELLGFPVARVDTVVCQNECSGHGHCDRFSKDCVCEPFWMPNYLTARWNGESNCDWSILYVVLTVLASLFLTIILIWMCVCCTRRCRRNRGRRKHTYKLLHNIEEMENEERLAKKKKTRNITAGNGSIFLSETEMSSEEDTLFMNGDTRNIDTAQDNLVKANNLKNNFRT